MPDPTPIYDNRKCPFTFTGGTIGMCIHTAGWQMNQTVPPILPRPLLDPTDDNYPNDVCMYWDIAKEICKLTGNAEQLASDITQIKEDTGSIKTFMVEEKNQTVGGILLLEAMAFEDKDGNSLIYAKDFKVKEGVDGLGVTHPPIPPMMKGFNKNLKDSDFVNIYFMDEIPGVVYPPAP